MTAEEKSNFTYGYTSTINGCSGKSGGVPRLGYPEFRLQDAGNGVRGTDMVNSYASGIHVGASWNQQLAYDRAKEMGREFKMKGVNVALGPVVGPLGRIARGGRNWAGFGNDAYLSGVLAGVTVRELQESVIACVKHFIANEQETSRNRPYSPRVRSIGRCHRTWTIKHYTSSTSGSKANFPPDTRSASRFVILR
ncbi:uncharacterized protein N7446_010632 [Penicillium canescens]|nr:uncharacterized protein N7446_010632 [Penicillium canescens]KAJ6050523.1 hypothetical protein N7446_010632 [Penicillium canescens]KAJ6064824.1 hypothetical protein N7444_000477 [Penicillium canescens]